ncbi:hypothetical protein [Marinobacter sp.]|uniref:hypothetical protein n=1 Tax=Marinobacter sp. TaxID=50741 RepID=UPI000C8DAEC9|nr:hypothetical protein [Marinobacter sp.]MAB53545.1 hypothetical protein [Marinobacter sp.]|tara:strand:+ start:1903 stop:2247 length:345 start_codon:yes stop_codon:yes gene_type:complete
MGDKIFYNAETNGFYRRSVHGKNIPEGSKEITEAQYEAAMAANRGGKRVVPGPDGLPDAADQLDGPQDSVMKARLLLRNTDWMVVRMAETGVEMPESVRKERQRAREVISDGMD